LAERRLQPRKSSPWVSNNDRRPLLRRMNYNRELTPATRCCAIPSKAGSLACLAQKCRTRQRSRLEANATLQCVLTSASSKSLRRASTNRYNGSMSSARGRRAPHLGQSARSVRDGKQTRVDDDIRKQAAHRLLIATASAENFDQPKRQRSAPSTR